MVGHPGYAIPKVGGKITYKRKTAPRGAVFNFGVSYSIFIL